MESQMTVDEQLDRMNEAEFKAFLEACTHKTKKTLEQAAMFSQLDRPAKAPEEQLPPLTTTKHSSSLQSLNQSHSSNSRKGSQINNASEAGNSSVSSSPSTGGTVGNISGYPCNNNTHHHHPHHVNSNFSSNNNHNSINNTNCTSTSLSSTSSTSGDHFDPSSYNSQNQQTVNCVTVVTQNNNSHHLYTPSSYYSSASSSPSHTEEDTATTSANSNSSSPNNTSYSTTTFTAAAPPSSRPYRYHSQPRQTPSSTTPSISTTTSSSISVNFNLKRPPTKPAVQNHVDNKSNVTLPSPYFFNCRTGDFETEQYREFGGHSSKDAGSGGDVDHVSEIETPFFQGATPQSQSGNLQLRGDYASVQSLTDCGSRGHQISPRHSRSGTPVQGETTSSSTSLSITRRNHGGPRNKRSKETVLLASDREYIGNTIGDNIDDLVSYISGQSEKPQPQMKKAKKKGKRKDTLSKSHSLDEKTLGIDVNPEIETRSASSTIFENKSGSVETPCVDISSDSLDLSLPSGLKVETVRSHSTADFITVTNRKKNKALKSGEQLKMKPEVVQYEDSSGKVEQISAPKYDGNVKESIVIPVETSKQEVSVVSKKDPLVKNEYVIKQEIAPATRVDSATVMNSKELNSRQELPRKPEGPKKTQPVQDTQKKVVEAPKSVEVRRRHDNPPPRRHDPSRRKDTNPKDDSQVREQRRPFLRQIGESRPYNAVVAEQGSRNSQIPPMKLSSDPTHTSSQDAVKFCGVNFDNKPTLLSKPNVNVEFGFGMTDVLSKLATSTPSEESKPTVEPPIDLPAKSPLTTKTDQPVLEVKEPVVSVAATVASNQTPPSDSSSAPLSETPISTKDGPSSAVADKESLLGRHPQAVLSPPVHYIPISMPVQMASGGGYPGQNIYHHLPSQALPVPVGVLPYYPGPHLQQSAPIMTALPTPGTGNMPPQYMNQVTLTQPQHQIYHQHHMLQHHLHSPQTQYTISQQQPIIQYQMKPSPPQQPYPGNPSSLAQFSPGQTAVPQHAQSNYSTQIQATGNYNYRQNNASRSNHSVVNPNSPQMGNYGLPSPHLLQQFGPGYQQYPNSHTNFSLGGPPTGLHYNYHRGNNPRSHQNTNLNPSNYVLQQAPSNAQSQPHAQAIRSLPPHGPVSSPVVATAPTPEDMILQPVTVQMGRYILVNPETNPLGQYYTPPMLSETDLQYARQGEEYSQNYVVNLQHRIEQTITTVHRI